MFKKLLSSLENFNVKKFQNAILRKVMKVRKFFFKKINAFIMTDWKTQGFSK